MNAFTYFCPTEIIFGPRTEKRIAHYIRKHNGTRVLLVYGKVSAVRNGLIDVIRNELEEEEIPYMLYGGAEPNPTLEYVKNGIRKVNEFLPDMILGIGGGSTIDAAKAIAHGIANKETDVWEFWTGRSRLRKSIAIGAVLTIPASGSEMSDSSVLLNEQEGKKLGFISEWNRPRFAILNPELTLTLSRYQIGCGIADIIMHTVERYLGNENNVVTAALAEALLKTVIQQARLAMQQKPDIKVMSELMWAGSLSQNGITGLGGSGDWACHAMGHELSAMFQLAHGASITAIWGAWANFVYPDAVSSFENFARQVWQVELTGEAAAQEGIRKTVDFFKEIGMPVSLKEAVGIQKEEKLLQMSRQCSQNGNLKIGKLKELGQEEILRIYQAANFS